MSYAQRYQRMRQTHRGSRDREVSGDNGGLLNDEILVGSCNRYPQSPPPQQQQYDFSQKSSGGHEPHGNRVGQQQQYFSSNGSQTGESSLSDRLDDERSTSNPHQHQQRHSRQAGNEKEEIIINISEAANTATTPRETKRGSSEVPIEQERTQTPQRLSESHGREREKEKTDERDNSPAPKEKSSDHQRSSAIGGGGSSLNTPNKRSSSSRRVSQPDTPVPVFTVSTREHPQPMPLRPESRKHFESPRVAGGTNPTSEQPKRTPGKEESRRNALPSRDGAHRTQASSPVGMVQTPREASHNGGNVFLAEGHNSTNALGDDTPHSAASSPTGPACRSVDAQILDARVQTVANARAEMERLLQNQSRYEERIVGILAALEEDCRQQQELLLHPERHRHDAGVSGGADGDGGPEAVREKSEVVDTVAALRQAERERDIAVSLLRQFKEEGNAVVQRMYEAVKSNEKENVRLLASQEALQRENKQLRRLFTVSTKRKLAPGEVDEESGKPILNPDDLASLSAPSSPHPACETSAANLNSSGSNNNGGLATESSAKELAAMQAQIREQKFAIAELGQLLNAADETMRALRRRVEVAESQKQALLLQAASTSLSFLGFTKKSSASAAADDGGASAAAKEEEQQPPSPMRRLLDKHPDDADVANVEDLLLTARARILDIQDSLQHEREGRLRAEVIAQELAVESEKNIRLLEERLQRAETPRGLIVPSGVALTKCSGTDETRSTSDHKGDNKANGAEAASRIGAKMVSVSGALKSGTAAEAADERPPPVEQRPQEAKEKPVASAPPPDPESSLTNQTTSFASPSVRGGGDAGTQNTGNGKGNDDERTSARSTPTRQLRTAWSEAADVTAGRGTAGETKGKEHKPPSLVEQRPRVGVKESGAAGGQTPKSDGQQRRQDHHTEDVVVEEDTTTLMTEDLTTMTSQSGRHHKPKRKRKTNHPKHADSGDGGGSRTEDLNTATSAQEKSQPKSALPEMPVATAVALATAATAAAAEEGGITKKTCGDGKEEASAAKTKAPIAAASPETKPPKAVKTYIGQKTGKGARSSDGSVGATAVATVDVSIPSATLPLAIPAPSTPAGSPPAQGSANNSFSPQTGNPTLGSPMGSRASRASSASRRMVLSLAPREDADKSEM